jgi:hypothetical protein
MQANISRLGQIRKKFDRGSVNEVGSFPGMTGVGKTELA